MYNFKSTESMILSESIIVEFEKRFNLILPPKYKAFISIFEITFWSDYFRKYKYDYILNSNFTIDENPRWQISLNSGTNMPELWPKVNMLKKCLDDNHLYTIFDIEEEELREKMNDLGLYAIGNYNNDNYYYVGIYKENFDKIFYFDKYLHDSPVFVCDNIFEFYSYFKAEFNQEIKFGKKLGERYFTCNEPWKINPNTKDNLLSNSVNNNENEFESLCRKNENNINDKYNVLIKTDQLQIVKNIFSDFENDKYKNPNNSRYNPKSFYTYLLEYRNELAFNPHQFPVLESNIRFAFLSNYLNLYYFFTVEGGNIKIFAVLSWSDLVK